jgi:hypothetical protein
METIGQYELWSFLDGVAESRKCTNEQVREDMGHEVHSYIDLARKVAELQFLNRDHVLLFRGQNRDYRGDKGSTLKPTLFRQKPGEFGPPGPFHLGERFKDLQKAEHKLIQCYEVKPALLGIDRLKRQRALRWSVLQHYEVCMTPLLDVTHSLRIAASFGAHPRNADEPAIEEAILYVLGVPNLSGAITASAEAGIQIIRLSSVCPPSAVRPHLQEGYLLGEYPEIAAMDQKGNYWHEEIDFGRRLVAKFRFKPKKLFKPKLFPMVPREALYPDGADDPLTEVVESVRKRIAEEAQYA